MNESINNLEENVVDLFQYYEELPEEVKNILTKYENCDSTYENCEYLLQELNEVGYTFEFYLDAVPFNLTKII